MQATSEMSQKTIYYGITSPAECNMFIEVWDQFSFPTTELLRNTHKKLPQNPWLDLFPWTETRMALMKPTCRWTHSLLPESKMQIQTNVCFTDINGAFKSSVYGVWFGFLEKNTCIYFGQKYLFLFLVFYFSDIPSLNTLGLVTMNYKLVFAYVVFLLASRPVLLGFFPVFLVCSSLNILIQLFSKAIV